MPVNNLVNAKALNSYAIKFNKFNEFKIQQICNKLQIFKCRYNT